VVNLARPDVGDIEARTVVRLIAAARRRHQSPTLATASGWVARGRSPTADPGAPRCWTAPAGSPGLGRRGAQPPQASAPRGRVAAQSRDRRIAGGRPPRLARQAGVGGTPWPEQIARAQEVCAAPRGHFPRSRGTDPRQTVAARAAPHRPAPYLRDLGAPCARYYPNAARARTERVSGMRTRTRLYTPGTGMHGCPVRRSLPASGPARGPLARSWPP